MTARSVLFYRDFRQFSGGHLKVWHYFNHVLSSAAHQPWVRFTPSSSWDETNPWRACRERVVEGGSTRDADVHFLAGLDWRSLGPRERRRPRRPVVNLVQHVRHAEPGDPRYEFLSHRALRICVSKQVQDAIMATGRVNGPVVTIPNAVDVAPAPPGSQRAARDIDVLVVANKQPELGRAVRSSLPGAVHLVDRLVPRTELLALLGRARVSVFLPNQTEGFYLPALEGMALGTLVVCPDCTGNRSFCAHDENCLRPVYEVGAIQAAAEKALALGTGAAEVMVERAAATAARHDLETERSAFLALLDHVDELGLV